MKPQIFLALLMGACSSEPVHYRNIKGGGQAEFDRDHYQCTRENTSQTFMMVGRVAGTGEYTDDNRVQACLRAHGWYPS